MKNKITKSIQTKMNNVKKIIKTIELYNIKL